MEVGVGGGGRGDGPLVFSPYTPTPGESSVLAYFPPAKWYDWYTRQAITKGGGQNISIDTPLDHIPVSEWFTTYLGQSYAARTQCCRIV
jgi:hypothetical protein